VLPGEEEYEPAWQSSHVYSLTAPCSNENLPATQPVHSPEPGSLLYVPAEHAAQAPPSFPLYPTLQAQSIKASLPQGESAFAGQLAHTAALVAPTSAEYLPPSQLLHDDGPGDVLYLPAEHAVQEGIAPVNPAMHSHSAAPCSESLPSGHDWHSVPRGAYAGWKVPAWHDEHDSPPVPGWQESVQFCSWVLPGGDMRPSSHCRHVSTDTAAVAAEYVASGQSVQAVTAVPEE